VDDFGDNRPIIRFRRALEIRKARRELRIP
jgi:hypothetical protein